MGDLLKQSAEAYQELMMYRYHFLLGRKGQLYRVSVEFPEESFFHLAGLHKLRVEVFKNRKAALQAALSGNTAGASTNDPEVLTRWQSICRLKELIETNRIVFKYRSHEFKGSFIRAEYLLMDEETMFFMCDGYPVSIFGPTNNQRQQAQKCPRLVTLRIAREEIATGEMRELFVSSSYKE